MTDWTNDASDCAVALIVMRGQPLHKGHERLIRIALARCGRVIIGLGSTQVSGVVRHPFTPDQRIDMIWAALGIETMQAVRIIHLHDIDSLDDAEDWARYVLGKIRKQRLPEPTDYFTGSMADAKWYFHAFAGPDDRVDATGDETTYVRGDRRLHIVDRTVSGFPPAEELRSLIERRDEDWRRFVPEATQDLVERWYPPRLRVALRLGSFPDHPEKGLAVIRTDMSPPTRFEFLRGRWTRIRPENASRFA